LLVKCGAVRISTGGAEDFQGRYTNEEMIFRP